MLPLWSVAKTRSTAGSTSVSTVAPPRAKHIGAVRTVSSATEQSHTPAIDICWKAQCESCGAAAEQLPSSSSR